MPTFLSELADLGIVLALICVPLAVAAIFIPLGRAIAAKVHRMEHDVAADPLNSGQVTERLHQLETITASLTNEIQRVVDQQRSLAQTLNDQRRITGRPVSGSEGRIITPH